MTGSRAARRPSTRTVLALLAVAAVTGMAGWWLLQEPTASGPVVDRHDPAAVAQAVVRRYALRDPAVCELVTVRLRAELDRQGRCTSTEPGAEPRADRSAETPAGIPVELGESGIETGETGPETGGVPGVTVLHGRTCRHRHGQVLHVQPPGAFTAPWVTVSLERHGDTWAADALLAVADRSVLRPYECAEPGP